MNILFRNLFGPTCLILEITFNDIGSGSYIFGDTYPVNVGAFLSDIPGGVVLIGAAFNLYESCVFVLVSET